MTDSKQRGRNEGTPKEEGVNDGTRNKEDDTIEMTELETMTAGMRRGQ